MHFYDKEYYKAILTIGVPVLIQNLISIGLNLLDTLMVGKLGEKELAAVGSANQIYFILTVICFGLFSGATIFMSQYISTGRIKEIRKILGMSYMTGAITAAIFVAGTYMAAPCLIALFDSAPEVVSLGSGYLRIACFSYLFSCISLSVIFGSRSINMLRVPTAINASALAINAMLNYVLIFGHCGIPRLGVRGAACATTLARFFECAALIIFIYTTKNHPFRAKFSELFSFTFSEYRSVMKKTLPVIVHEGSWAFSVAALFAIYGKLGTQSLAVAQIANSVHEFLQSLNFGINNTCAVIVGNSLGRSDLKQAEARAAMSIRITWILNIFVFAILILIRGPIAAFYGFGPSTTQLLYRVFLAFAVTSFPKSITYLITGGILRAGGDTLYGMVVDCIFYVFIQLGLAALGVFVLKVPLYWAVILAGLSDLTKLFVVYHRYHSRKWLNVLIETE